MGEQEHQEVQRSEAGDTGRASRSPTAPTAHPALALQRAAGNRAVARIAQEQGRGRSRPLPLLQAAVGSPARPLDRSVREPLEQALGESLDGVRVHEGNAPEAAAAAIGARAYTVGRDVYLGREARTASADERRRLLAHEAVHTVQQGGGAVALHDSLPISAPSDLAEREAAAVADALASPRPALRRRVRVARVAPAIQRDLVDDYDVKEGTFKLNLKTESHAGDKSGMSGTIKFIPKAGAPDSTRIRLFQALRFEDLVTGKDYVWTGAYKGRSDTETVADPARGIDPGWGIDHDPTTAKPRTKLSDATVGIYYRDWWPNSSDSQDGSKQGAAIQEASLWDYPGHSANMRFSFETVAQATDTGHIYGSVAWGFTISDASKGEITHEYASGRDVTLATTDEALRRFNEHYRNPGASKAPKK